MMNSGRSSDLVKFIISFMVSAETINITQDNVHQYSFPDHITPEFQQRIRQIISTVGYYGELYEQVLSNVIPRNGFNTLN